MGADRPFRQWEDRADRDVGRVAFFSRLALGAKGLAEDVSKKEIPGQQAGYFGEIV